MKRGQSSMEFLMSYGWVLLVVLIGITVLAYFGLLSPGDKVPHNCVLFPGIACTDFRVDQDGITIIVANGGGKDISNIQFEVAGTGICGGEKSNSEELKDGVERSFFINCTEELEINSPFKEDLIVRYNGREGLNHTRIGQISSKVES